MAISGFVLQFVGLSILHWSATVAVLVISLIMTCIRAWTRRGLAKSPLWVAVPENYELPWLVMRSIRNDWLTVFTEGESLNVMWTPLMSFLSDAKLTDPKASTLPPGCLTLDELKGLVTCDTPLSRDLDSCHDFVSGAHNIGKKQFNLGFIKPDSVDQCLEIRMCEQAIAAMPSLDRKKFGSLASAVLRAIKGINSSLTKDRIEWKIHQYPLSGMDWRIDVRNSKGLSAPWIIPLSASGEVEKIVAAIASGLTFWTCSLGIWKEGMARLFEYREMTSINVTPCPDFGNLQGRIVGSTDFYSLEEFRWWLSDSTVHVVENEPKNPDYAVASVGN